MTLRDPLPLIAIPLRPEDEDATLDLQKLINLAYSRGNYGKVAYRKRSDPLFDPADEEWIDMMLAELK